MSNYPVASVSSPTRGRTPATTYQTRQVDSFEPVGLKCWVAMPKNPDPTLPPLVAVHGILRDAKGMLKAITARLAQGGRMVIAPLFDEVGWRGYQRVTGKRRADLALLSLLKRIKSPDRPDIQPVDLLGYSGGAQFAHRFALLYPHLIGRLALCSAGWYTFPDEAPYPCGLSVPRAGLPGITTLTRTNLPCFLRLPINVYVGEHDTEIDPNLRRGQALDRQQGRNRVERAANWVAALKKVAATHGLQSKVKLTVLEGCGHDFRQCVHQGRLVEDWFHQSERPGSVSARLFR